MTNKHFRAAVRPPHAWHDIEYIHAVSPEGEKFRLAYHFYQGVMNIWMFGCTYHSVQDLKAAGWELLMPERARR